MQVENAQGKVWGRDTELLGPPHNLEVLRTPRLFRGLQRIVVIHFQPLFPVWRTGAGLRVPCFQFQLGLSGAQPPFRSHPESPH